jgi:glycosyltransferase involved in cell wall biosynthesis
VLIEAASQGTAAVSTSLSGPRDVVINGVTGFLHEPGDVDGFARSLATLARLPQRAADMGAHAQTLVKARFDPERLRAQWIDLWITVARARSLA